MKTEVVRAALILSVGFTLVGCGGLEKSEDSPVYFSYSPDEIQSLRELSPMGLMSSSDLYDWDQTIFDLVSAAKIGDAPASKIYAYLATAQADAAALSSRASGRTAGSLAPVSRGTVCLFFPGDCPLSSARPDPYSERLAEIVLDKIKTRISEDARATRLYAEKKGKQYWQGVRPYYAQETGSWKTWTIGSLAGFDAPAPPADDSAEMKRQLKQVKEALRQATPQQRNAVVFWAGGPGTKTPPGQWLDLADDLLRVRNASLEKALAVRCALTRAIADAVIVVFHNKYTYWMRRPFMVDPSIQTIMPTPNHPSYPAGHGTISGAAATVLSEHFPEEKQDILKKAFEANNSRLWGGIHFPQDNEQGFLLGQKLARKGLEKAPR